MNGRLLGPAPDRLPRFPATIWEAVDRVALVVLDEVGTRGTVSDWHYETVKRVLDTREGKPLLVAGNLSLDALAQVYDDRVASRLVGGSVVHIGGPDRRLPASRPSCAAQDGRSGAGPSPGPALGDGSPATR